MSNADYQQRYRMGRWTTGGHSELEDKLNADMVSLTDTSKIGHHYTGQ